MLSQGKRKGDLDLNPNLPSVSRAVMKVLMEFPEYKKQSDFASTCFMHDAFMDFVVDGLDVFRYYTNTKRRIYDVLSVFRGVGLVKKNADGWKFEKK